MALAIAKGSGVRSDSRGDRFRARVPRRRPRRRPYTPALSALAEHGSTACIGLDSKCMNPL